MRNSNKPDWRPTARARRPAVAPEAGVGLHRTLDAAALEFRPALPSDAAACVDIRARTRENAVSAERLASMGITAESWGDDIATGALRGHVCTLDGAIVAYCFGDRKTGEVVVLALLPPFEHRGLGRTLLEQVLQDLTSFGHARLFLGCARDPSTRSYGFYRHLGWVSTGTIDSNDDEVLELFTPRANERRREGQGDATEVRWRQTFDTAEHYERIAQFVASANAQNPERLAAEVQRVKRAA